jgi:serine/threonine-protein kinase RsbW
MAADNWRVKLELPAESRYLHIVRLTAAGAAAEAGLDAAEIEDVKIAVDELCSVAIDATSRDKVLVLEFVAVATGLLVEASVPADHEPQIDELARAILDATVDGIEFDGASLGGGFRLTKSHSGG